MRDWILIEFCISFFIKKYCKFTGNSGSGNITDTFSQNNDKFQKSGSPHTYTHPLGTPLGIPRTAIYDTKVDIFQYKLLKNVLYHN